MKKTQFLMPLIMGFFALCVFGSNIQAQDIPSVNAKILLGQKRIALKNTYDSILDIKMGENEGWHTYYYAPGEAGLAPQFDWSNSENIKDIQIFYPAPKRIEENEYTVFGYKDNVMFPMRITLEDDNKPATLNFSAKIMICKDICIPQDIQINKKFSKQDAKLNKNVQRAFYKLPRNDHPLIELHNLTVNKDNLVMIVKSKQGFDGINIFVTATDESDFTKNARALTGTLTIKQMVNTEDSAVVIINKTNDIENFNDNLQGKVINVVVQKGAASVSKIIKTPKKP